MKNEGTQRSFSRKRFLVAVGRRGCCRARPRGRRPPRAVRTTGIHAAVRTDHFGRILRLPPFAAQSPRVEAALIELGRAGGLLDANDPLAAGPAQLIVDPALSANNPNNPSQTAGTTFFGQFLDHDIIFDASSRLARPTNPEQARNFRTPALDLDSVYGAGPVADQAVRPGRPHQAEGGERRALRGPAALSQNLSPPSRRVALSGNVDAANGLNQAICRLHPIGK
jgi:hypothetical protein